jgi:hypothetical protein
MTIVLALRDLKKNLVRPVSHLWPRAERRWCVVRVRLAFLGLLGLLLGDPLNPGLIADGHALAVLCGVLSAAVSAAVGLLCDASVGLCVLFRDDTSPVFRLGRRLSLCPEEQVFPLDLCLDAGPFPAFSLQSMIALLLCSLFLFGAGFRRTAPSRGARTRGGRDT